MIEKRKAERRVAQLDSSAVVVYGGAWKVLSVIDVSPGGMKAIFPGSVEAGAALVGKVAIFPGIDSYISGKVVRVKKVNGVSEAAIKFEKVRMHSFF